LPRGKLTLYSNRGVCISDTTDQNGRGCRVGGRLVVVFVVLLVVIGSGCQRQMGWHKFINVEVETFDASQIESGDRLIIKPI